MICDGDVPKSFTPSARVLRSVISLVAIPTCDKQSESPPGVPRKQLNRLLAVGGFNC